MSYSIASVVSIAGSDSSGGAGIQADLKTIEAFGLYGQTVVTALTAQNTCGVYGVADTAADFVRAQMDAVFSDIAPAATKIGMVPSPEIAEAVADGLAAYAARNVVLDPVMVATSGAALIGDDARACLVERLFPLAALITPNIPEAEALAGMPVRTRADMERAALVLSEMTPGAVLVKGGHGTSGADDLLCLAGTLCWIEGKRVETANTHGTGCTLSSAAACGLACGFSIDEAVRDAKRYVSGALAAGLDLGAGSGPLDHAWRSRGYAGKPSVRR